MSRFFIGESVGGRDFYPALFRIWPQQFFAREAEVWL